MGCAYQELYPSGFFTLDGLEDDPAGKRNSIFRADRVAHVAEIKFFLPSAQVEGADNVALPASRSTQAARAYR